MTENLTNNKIGLLYEHESLPGKGYVEWIGRKAFSGISIKIHYGFPEEVEDKDMALVTLEDILTGYIDHINS